MVKINPRKGAGELLTPADDLAAVVVLAIVRHLDPLFLGLADRVLDREREFAERGGIKADPNRVLADLQALSFPQHRHDLGERKLDRVVRAHVRGRKGLFPHCEPERIERDRPLVDLDLLDAGDDGITEAVLEAEDHTIGRVLQTSVGVKLLQHERRDLHTGPPRRKARSLYLTRTNRGSEPARAEV
jgi:hypothetical protein